MAESEQQWWRKLVRQSCLPAASGVPSVLDFTAGADLWPKANLRALDAGNWILANWEGEWEQTRNSQARLRLCQLALQQGGPILELAAGAGGGNLVPLLHLSPHAELMVNDLESRLLTRWAAFLADRGLGQHTVFAAFDACDMPLRDGSLACISAVGGFGSLLGSGQAALCECARTLRPSGKLMISELVFSNESLAALPAELRQNWATFPWLLGRGEWLLTAAGFTIDQHWVEGGRRLDQQHDGLAEEAERFGLALAVEYHYWVASK